MRRTRLILVISLLFITIGLFGGRTRAVEPGSAKASAAENFDPFNPTASAAASSPSAASTSTAAVAVPNTSAMSASSTMCPPRTPVNPSPPCISVLDPPTAIQSSTKDGTVNFPVTLSAASTSVITVHYATSNGTDGGDAGEDYTAKSGVLTFSPGQTTINVPVTILAENETLATLPGEGLEHFYLTISDPTNATICRPKATCAIQPPIIAVTVGNSPNVDQSTARETQATFPISLNSPATTPVTVNFSTLDGTAKGGIDYLPLAGSVTFPPGTTVENVNVKVLAGNSPTDRTFYLVATSASGAPGLLLYQPRGSCEIVGQNAANPPLLSINDTIVDQSSTARTTATFTVILTTAATVPVTVHYATADGSGASGAKNGIDYVGTTGTLTFAPNQTAKAISVTILPENNNIDKFFVVNLSDPVGAAITRATGTCRIIPSMIDVAVADAPSVQKSYTANGTAIFTVTLSGESNKTISVEYATSDGTAVHNVDYVAASGVLTFSPGAMSLTVPVTVLAGSNMSNTTFYLNLSAVTGPGAVITRAKGQAVILGEICDESIQITVNDITVVRNAKSNVIATFTVSLSGSKSWPITVNYATSDGAGSAGAMAGTDYVATSGTLTFAAGTTSKTVSVNVLPGTGSVQEKFHLNLSMAVGAAIARPQGTCTIIPAALDIAVGNAPNVQRSLTASMTASFTVTLSSPATTPVTVQYATSDGTAVKGIDYVPVAGTLTFSPGQTSKAVAVTVLTGSSATNKTFYLNLSNAAGAGAAITVAQGSCTILADSALKPVTITIGDVTADQSSKGSVVATFPITLSAASTSPVKVQYATKDGSATANEDYTPVSGTITFAPGQTSLSVSVTVIAETDEDLEESFYVTLSDPSGATIARSQGTCTIVPPEIQINLANAAPFLRSKTADTTAVFTVTLSAASNKTITVYYTTADGTAIHNVDYKAASGTLTFVPYSTTATIDVTTLPIEDAKPTLKTFYVNLSNPTGLGATIGRSQGAASNEG